MIVILWSLIMVLSARIVFEKFYDLFFSRRKMDLEDSDKDQLLVGDADNRSLSCLFGEWMQDRELFSRRFEASFFLFHLFLVMLLFVFNSIPSDAAISGVPLGLATFMVWYFARTKVSARRRDKETFYCYFDDIIAGGMSEDDAAEFLGEVDNFWRDWESRYDGYLFYDGLFPLACFVWGVAAVVEFFFYFNPMGFFSPSIEGALAVSVVWLSTGALVFRRLMKVVVL